MLFSLYAKESFNVAVESYMKSFKKIDPLIGQYTLERQGNSSLQRNSHNILGDESNVQKNADVDFQTERKKDQAANHEARDKSKATTFQPQPAPRLSRVNWIHLSFVL